MCKLCASSLNSECLSFRRQEDEFAMLHIIPFIAVSCPHRAKNNHVIVGDFFIPSGWSLVIITTHIIPSASAPWLVLLGPNFTTSFVSSQGPRLSNRDCACLRLSPCFKVGSYPSLAIQPSILAWYGGRIGNNVASREDMTGCKFCFIQIFLRWLWSLCCHISPFYSTIQQSALVSYFILRLFTENYWAQFF